MERGFETKEIPLGHLSEPTPAVKASYLEAVREFVAAHEWTENEAKRIEEDPDGWIEKLKEDDKESHGREGRVRQATLWMIDGDKYIGSLRLRHRLNEQLKEVGGNIGYAVRPSERKKGYATQMLALGLDKAREEGLAEVLVTCDEDNVASQKVIEANGGELLGSNVTIEGREKPIRRYKIRLADIPKADEN